jgi:hypothetical protein
MGRFLVMCTLLADALGLFASYAAGVCLFPALGSILPGWLSWLRDLCIHLYQAPLLWMSLILHMPSAVPLALLRDPGLTWSIAYLGAHLWYLARHLLRRYRETDLARPHPGAPGGRRWETVQRRYQDYREALQRFRPAIPLKTPPTFRFFTRKPNRDTRSELEWWGYVLVIDQALLSPERQQELAPGLAHQLAYYNSEDLWFRGFLDCYPDRFSWLQCACGIFLWLPTLLKVCVWPTVYWRGRVLAADRFASYCGQGYLLYRQLRTQGEAEERRSFWSPDPLRAERIEHLEALLGTEYAWMERQGIAQLVQPPALPPVQAPRQLRGG